MLCQRCGEHGAEFAWNLWDLDRYNRVLVCAACSDQLADMKDRGLIG